MGKCVCDGYFVTPLFTEFRWGTMGHFELSLGIFGFRGQKSQLRTYSVIFHKGIVDTSYLMKFHAKFQEKKQI